MTTKPDDRSRALLRGISDCIKRLEKIYANDKAIKTVFSYEAYGLRLRLKEMLHKLMCHNSVSYAKRADELLWRRVFYEPLHLYKSYIKNNDRPDRVADFELSLRMHILSGIGYYQSLLLQVQSEASLTLPPTLWLTTPFHAALYNENIYHFELCKILSHVESAYKIAQRCLMYIGDLFRYLMELGESCAKTVAFVYYSAAFHVDPTLGLPQNQLGILDVGRCYGLNALYHYLLCLGARMPFEGARRNLLTVLSKNEVRYRKLFGDKPIYGLYLRHPNRYRPKDFRRTITKFIFIIQQFLKPSCSNWDSDTPRVVNDALFEFHLMLSINPEITLEPPSNPCGVPSAHEHHPAEQVCRVEDHSLYSEQLTGPIFVRILLIALLTANLFGFEQIARKASGNGRHSEVDGDASRMNCEVSSTHSSSEDQQVEQNDKTERASRNLSHVRSKVECSSVSPLSFLLQLSQIFMDHVSRQLNDLPPAESTDNHLRRTELTKDCNREIGDYDVDSATVPTKSHSESVCVAQDHPATTGEADEDAEIEASDQDIPDPVLRYSAPGNCSLDDEERRMRLAMNAPSSDDDDDDSDQMFGERGMDAESDEDNDDDEEEELSPEFWSSDDSSPLHSQDELASPDHSVNEEDDDAPLSDRRLRRLPRITNSTFDENPRRSARMKSDVIQESRCNTSITKNDSCPAKELSNALDPITEEESVVEEKLPPQPSESDSTRKSIEFSSEVSNEFDSFRNTKSTAGMRYSRRITQSIHGAPDFELQHGTDETLASTCSSVHEIDSYVRARSISRLYLLPVVRLVAEWICCIANHHPELLDSFSPKEDQNSRSISLVCQDWCAQLSHLLNELHPLIAQLETEIEEKPNGYYDWKVSSVEVPISDVLSQFGRYAVLHELRKFLSYGRSSGKKNVDQSTHETTEPSISDSNQEALVDKSLGFVLPEDWLLRGLASLTSVQAQLDFDRTSTLPTFTLIDEAVLRSIRLTFLGHRLAECQNLLGAQFSVDCTKSKPFVVPERPEQSQILHSLHHPPFWMFPGRRGRGRYPHRYHHALHYRTRPHGRGEFTVGPGRWASKRGNWFAHARGAGARGYRPRPHPANFVHRQSKLVLPCETQTNSGNFPHSRRPTYGTKVSSTRSGTNPNVSPVRAGVEDLAKQSSNSSLPPAESEVSHGDGQAMPANDEKSRKAQLMHDMARLRLLSEVDQLARQCQNASPCSQQPKEMEATYELDVPISGGETSSVTDSFVSPYVVLDAYCLTSHLSAVKQLVHSGAFVLIIPAAVIAHLDYLKKTMATSRYAIRYLEQEIHSGNRYIRLQRPEEQPPHPLQLPRLVYSRNSGGTTSGPTETGYVDEEIHSEAGPIAHPRVVRRWVSIVDCAIYFSQLKTNEEPAESGRDRHSQSDIELLSGSSVSADTHKGDTKGPDNSQCSATLRDDIPSILINSPETCCDLLKVFHKSSRGTSPEQELRKSLVTVLVGSRDTVPEDTIVPREFLNLVQKAGIRMELLRDFVQRCKMARRSIHPAAEHDADPN